ncbi:helix-turn-helix transcriptional regulator [Streptomyces sp. SCSIO ZS0520]|uniref:helix-turn-helix transcriptional regulator n=1 Tax=Streptomyces sp. SCSIO ZS0520 TaxID=2892996 RepID=UPI0021D7EABE|nr:LuxR family transcriptional regulator [Streptomyces sp. SCSIO ZS0520]
MTALNRAFDISTSEAQASIVLLSGAVGSGKTVLLEEFTEGIKDQVGTVIQATGSPGESDLDFGLVSQLFQGAEPRDSSSVLGALLEFTELGPLVLVVDDVQYADRPSLDCLLYAVRRLRNARIMVVLTESPTLQMPNPGFRAELLSQSNFTWLSLDPLGVGALTRMVTEEFGPDDAVRTAGRILAATGGNPLLAGASLQHYRSLLAESDGSAIPQGVDIFDHAVLRSLYRQEPGVRRVAQALAVLARPVDPAILAELLDTAPEFVVQALTLLQGAGLAECPAPEAHQLRHSTIARAVLAGLSFDERRQLHRCVASVLYDHGNGPSVVAEHLVQGDSTERGWSSAVLQEAARHATAKGMPDKAEAFLKLARRCENDCAKREKIEQLLVQARWQMNPLAAKASLDAQLSLARAGDGAAWKALPAVPYLLWHGQADDVCEVLCRAAAHPAPDPTAAAQLRFMSLLSALVRPGCSDALAPALQVPLDQEAAGSPELEAFHLLSTVLGSGAGEETLAAAENLLQRHSADASAGALTLIPLTVLLCAGRPERVLHWTGELLNSGQLAPQRSPTWTSILHALHAEAALRLGEVTRADEYARRAVREISLQAWGVAGGFLLATLVGCAVECEQYDEAALLLAYPVPPGLFDTPLYLPYLMARARYHVATGRLEAALDDLHHCAGLMTAWNLDLPGFLPWRLEMARVQLALGRRQEAAALVHEHLRLHEPLDAATHERVERLLAEAGTAGSREGQPSAPGVVPPPSGNWTTPQPLGDPGLRPRQMEALALGRAPARPQHRPSAESPAPLPPQRRPQEPAAPAATDAGNVRLISLRAHLTRAERRVAALAVQGLSNREISRRLFVTVSTVEQHLTRIYRKLDVKNRDKLPTELLAFLEQDPNVAGALN